MITILDIAKMANVSRTTVSRVLNNSGYVSEDAKERVMKVIEETGYVPSRSAQSLRTKKTKVIGVILPKISTETSSKVVSGIDEELSKRGYHLILANTNLSLQKEIESIRLMVNRQVDGIILVATNTHESLVQEIRNLKVPFVAIGQKFSNCSYVTYDDYHAAKDLTNLFLSKGRDRLAYIGVNETDESVGILRKQGYLDALKENQIEIQNEYIALGDFQIESGYRLMKEILEERRIVPNGLFAATDRLAIGAMTYLKEKSFSIPGEIAVAGIGTSEIAKYITPSLTTVSYNNEDAGKAAAGILLQQIAGNLQQPQKVIQNYRLIQRDSL